jgi:hypothetical protein
MCIITELWKKAIGFDCLGIFILQVLLLLSFPETPVLCILISNFILEHELIMEWAYGEGAYHSNLLCIIKV